MTDKAEEDRSTASPPPSQVVLAQWNFGSTSMNPFEYAQPKEDAAPTTLEGPALRFAQLVSDVIESAINGPPEGSLAHSLFSHATCADLLEPLQSIVLQHPVAGRVFKVAPGTNVASYLRSLHSGEISSSESSHKYRRQTWSLLMLTPSTASPLVRMIWAGDRIAFWLSWFEGLLRKYPEADQDVQGVLPLAILEGIMLTASIAICDQESQAFADVDSLASSVAACCVSLCASVQAKALGVARVLQGVAMNYGPDIFCFQEFSVHWLSVPGFAAFWNFMQDQYEIFDTLEAPEKSKMTKLLIRKTSGGEGGRPLAVDRFASKDALAALVMEDFQDEVGASFRKVFGDSLGEVMLEHVTNAEGFAMRQLALAVCHVHLEHGSSKKPLLVASGHASSHGADNRAMVLYCKVLAEYKGWDLLMALDASCVEILGEQAMEGAASQSSFVEFLRTIGVRHCFEHLGGDAADAKRFHTRHETRTFYQCHLHLAGVANICAQDFVLGFGEAFTSITGCRVNTPSGFSSLEQLEADGAVSLLPEESSTWQDSISMPTAAFGSSHALVLASAA